MIRGSNARLPLDKRAFENSNYITQVLFFLTTKNTTIPAIKSNTATEIAIIIPKLKLFSFTSEVSVTTSFSASRSHTATA